MIAKEMLKEFRQAFAEAAEPLEERFGIAIELGNIKFSRDEFSGKISAKVNVDESGNALDLEKEEFCKYASFFGLKDEDYLVDCRFAFDGNFYVLVGFKPKAKKNKAIIRNKVSGAEYVCRLEDLRRTNGDPLIGSPKQASNTHTCPYCGGVAEGPDENLLCSDCRELFGHTFISEL